MKKISKKIYMLFFISTISFSQPFNNGFNFYLPSSDSSTQKFLPVFPKQTIGDSDFVKINEEGKFSVNGKRIRFWGTNSVADNAFPSKDIGGIMAKRLRKFGFNLIRLHHLDNPWSNKSLLGRTSTRQLNQTYLDLLENYIANLKANGIYINMNLHVSRTFGKDDGVVNYDSIPEFGKCVNFIDPYIMQLHKEYAQQLLTHINPYTKKALVDDPVMAMVEITNENSLYRNWRSNQLKPIAEGGILPYRYSKMLDSLWIDFLKSKYQTTENLRNAWNLGLVDSGLNEQIKNGGFESGNMNWVLEIHSPANATFTLDNTNSYSGSYSGKVVVTNSSGTDWHIQFKQTTIKLIKDSLYTVSFAMRSDTTREISVSLMNDNSPWTWYGGKSITVTNKWKIYSFSLRASETNNGHTRLSFALGKTTGTYWFDNVSVTNAITKGLDSNESIENKNIKRLDYADCAGYSNKRVKDLSEFYINLQRNYFKEMIRYLKEDLGVKVPIVTSNWTVGPADLASLSDGDYVDNHAYWDHPQFPNEPWSTTDWLINNSPMVKQQDGGTIPTLLASVPVEGKPFTISEYNHPNPNQYQVESVLFTTCYSSFYDADALMYFSYDEPGDWNIDKINGFFGINRNSIYMAFFPSIAYAFRNGFIKPSVSPFIIDYSTDTLYSLPKYDTGDWRGASLINSKIGLVHAIKVGKYFSNSTTNINQLQTNLASPFETDTKEIIWNTNDGTIILSTEKINGAAGYLSNLKNKFIGKVKIIDFPSLDFGAFTWISLTDDDLSISQKSLITIGSKIQNTNMIWDGINTIHNNWGSDPTIIYPLNLKLELNINADSIRIFPLDNYGKENTATSFIVKPYSTNQFQIEFDQNKYKTLWFGIEKYGEGGTTGVNDKTNIPKEFKLEQNFPNPFNPTTTISYSIKEKSQVRLSIYDILGREVDVLVDEVQDAGNYNVNFSSFNFASGIYFYKLRAGNFIDVKKMILLK